MSNDASDELNELKRTVASLAARVDQLESDARRTAAGDGVKFTDASARDPVPPSGPQPLPSQAAKLAEAAASPPLRPVQAPKMVLSETVDVPNLPALTEGDSASVTGATNAGDDASNAGEDAMAAAAAVDATVVGPGSGAQETAAASVNKGSLESRIGQIWLNRIGIASLVIGLAFLLMYSFQYFGAQAKLASGVIISLGLIALGEWTGRKKGTPWFGSSLIGGGWALAYFTAYASHFVQSVQVVGDATTAGVLMLATALGAMTHAITRKAQEIANLSIVLGYITVALTGPSPVSLVANLGLLAATGVLAVKMQWQRLLLYSTIASYLVVIPHFQNFSGHTAYGIAESMLAIGLLFVYWLAYVVCGVMASKSSQGKSPLLVASALTNAFCFTIGYFASMEQLRTIGFGEQVDTFKFPATIAVALVYAGASYWFGKIRQQGMATLYMVLGVFMATISVLLKFDQQTQTAALYSMWALEAGVLAWAGLNYAMPALRRFAYGLATIVNLFTIFTMISITWMTTWTGQTAFSCMIEPLVAIASAALVAWFYRRRLSEMEIDGAAAPVTGAATAGATPTVAVPDATTPTTVDAASVPQVDKVITGRSLDTVMLSFGYHSYIAAAAVLCWFMPVLLAGMIKGHLLPDIIGTHEQLYVVWWALQSAVLVALGIRRDSLVIRILGIIGFVSTVLTLLVVQPGITATTVVAAMFFAMAWLYRKYYPRLAKPSSGAKPPFRADKLWTMAGVAVMTFILPASLPAHLLAPYWAIEGMALLVAGFRLGEKTLRVCGLAAFVMLVGKLLFVDLAAADTLQRIISFIVAGLVLLASSYGYARFAKLLESPENAGS